MYFQNKQGDQQSPIDTTEPMLPQDLLADQETSKQPSLTTRPEDEQLSFPIQAGNNYPSGQASQPPAATPPSGKKTLSRRKKITYLILVAIVLLASISGTLAYISASTLYSRDMGLAKTSVQHLQNAEQDLKLLTQGSLNPTTVTKARQEFVLASQSLKTVNNDVQTIPGIATSVPKYGSEIDAAIHLTPMAYQLSQAGITSCDALTILIRDMHSPFGTSTPGITPKDYATLKSEMAAITTNVDAANVQLQQLTPADLNFDPRISKVVTAIPAVVAGLKMAQTLIDVAPALLGVNQPATYLIEQMDSSELRPGGGFVGTYGIGTLQAGHIKSVKLTDTYSLDLPYTNAGNAIPYPPTYSWFGDLLVPGSWSLRDSNLDSDFPTVARYAEQLYKKEGGTANPLGVIAITPKFIQALMTITGPIYVNEYNETVTANNIIDRIHYHQLNEEGAQSDIASVDGLSSNRKHFTAVLFTHLFSQLGKVAPTNMGRIFKVMSDAVQQKDLQIYFNNTLAEQQLQNNHLASTIQTPTNDGLMVVDANVNSNKSNQFVNYNLTDNVTIDSKGNATHHTTLSYYWPFNPANQANNYGGTTTLLCDYLRIYTPAGSTLQSLTGIAGEYQPTDCYGDLKSPDGWTNNSKLSGFGNTIWAGVLSVHYGSTQTVTATWQAPHASVKTGSSWQYNYLLQKQPGTHWHVQYTVTLPGSAKITKTAGNTQQKNTYTVSSQQDLTTNTTIAVKYTLP